MTSVLIVDDALFMRVTISKMFEQWGFEVVGQASNGKQAVKLYKEFQPDLVTMDLTMPVMSGLDAVKKILAEFPEANIIMITALGQHRFVVEALESGAKDFITKPFTQEKLKSVIDKIFL